jgi:thiamine-monophosphate kinase
VTVSDLTESELIARVQSRLPPAPEWLVVGIGDDAAVVEPERNRLEVLSVDAIVEGVHFDRRFTPPSAIGHRALAVNLSDLAAMGAAPRLALLSMALPAAYPCADFDELVGGLAALAARHRVPIIGGNLTRSPGPLVVDVTIAGTAKRRQVLTRAGARPGDDLYVTGAIGAATAGLQMLHESGHVQPRLSEAPTHANPVSDCGSEGLHQHCIQRYLYAEPLVKVGLLLARNRAATACVDLSDGLADGVRQLAAASKVGARVEIDRLPIDPIARRWFEAQGLDPVVQALSGGDDYELAFASRPRLASRLLPARRHGGVPLTRIGVFTKEPDLLLCGATTTGTATSPLPRGFSHFS